MSSLQDEVSTETSEDFGFKFLGQKQILPSFNEKPPFASLQNLAISNGKSLFIAASGNKVVVGELQMLRDHITSDAESNPTPLVFKWENEVLDVIFVCFHGNQALIATGDTLYSIDLEKLGELQTVFSFESPICQLKDFNNTLIYLSSNKNLSTLDIKTKSTNQLAQNVASFDVANSQLLVLLKDRSFQSFSLQNGTPEKTFEFSIPSELDEFSVDEYAPLNVTILSQQIYLVVFGNLVSETDEEASYDQKMFIIKYTNGNASFQETFDVIPPFGQILRFPYVYNVTLPDLIKPAENVNILASSCSSEVSIWDSDEVIEPSQDAERAVLPISEETDMDTNPIGVAVDVITLGTISEPCSGVDTIERLPLVYILNNEGNLQIVGLFHVSAIKNGNYNVKLESEESEMPTSGSSLPFTAPLTLEKKNMVEQEQEKEENKEQSKSSPSDNPFISSNTSGFSFLQKEQPSTSSGLQSQNASAFSASSFGSSAFSFSSLSTPSVNPGTASNEQSTTGTAFGKPAFGKPAFGTSTKEPSIPASAFGKPSFGTAAFGSGVTAAEPSDSAPAFGKPSFGKPAFGAAVPESSTSESAFGKSSFGTPAFGTTTNGPSTSGSAFGKLAFGSPFASATEEPFDFGSTTAKLPANALFAPSLESSSTLFGINANTPNQANTNAFSFGNSTLGSSSFSKALDSVDTDTNTSNFGNPTFGPSSVPNALSTDTHINFGTHSSPFSSQLGNNSPFSSLTKDNAEVETIEKGSASEVNDDDDEDDDDDDEEDDSSISDNDLTDTTVEQTPSRLAEVTSNTNNGVVEQERPKSSIGRLTETIKKSANIDMSDLENPFFENNVKAKSESPFSAFATNIKKPSSTTPAFSFGNSTINNNSTFIAPSASEEVSSPSKEGTKNKESCEKEAVTSKTQYRSEENPFLPERKESSNETSEEESSQEESDDSSESNPVNSDNTSEQVYSTSNQEKEEWKNVIPQDENTYEKLETESKYSKHVAKYGDKPKSTEEGSDIDENIDQEGEQRNGNGLQNDDAEEELEPNTAVKEFQDHNSEEDAVSEQDAHQSNESEGSDEDNSSTSGREESISESYDKLEDINTDELPHGGETPPVNDEEHFADSNVQTSPENNYVESGIQTDLSESSQENEVQTDAVPVKHNYTQTVEKEVVDNDIQTEPIETCNFSVQAFEGDENYLAEQYKPKPLMEYYTGAKVSNISFFSQNSTLRLIESTFQMVEAEFSVLKENIQNMDSFFIDQSSTHLETRSIHSVNNIYTWRIPEAEILSNILNDVKSEHMQVTNANVKELEEKMSSYIEKTIANVNDDVINAKEQFLFLSYFNETSSEFVKDLSTHQFKMQTTLRQKLSKVSTEINHVEEVLNILKLFSVKNKRLDENPLVVKLVKESFARGGLLQEMKSLREEVSRLQLKDKSKETTSLEPSSSLTKDINGSKVVEAGLTLNTKKQIGGFFKNLNLGKY